MPRLRLTYFDSPGRAEPLRVALSIAKIPFEDTWRRSSRCAAPSSPAPSRSRCATSRASSPRAPGPFVTGATLTIADILLGITVQQYRSGTLDGLGPEVLEAYPRLRALGDAYAAHPGVVAYHNRGAA